MKFCTSMTHEKRTFAKRLKATEIATLHATGSPQRNKPVPSGNKVLIIESTL